MYILGAGTLGELVVDTAHRAGLTIEGFFDDVVKAPQIDGIPILGGMDDFERNPSIMASGAFVAIGDNRKRRARVERLLSLGVSFPNVVDPSSVVSPMASLGQGNLLLPGSYVGTKCKVGSYNLIFPGVSITHHNVIGDYCFFSPNVSFGGFTQVGDGCKVGMNSVVKPYRELPQEFECAPLSLVEGRPLARGKKIGASS